MALTRVRFYRARHRDKASIPSSSEMKASKNQRRLRSRRFKPFKLFKSLKALSANSSGPDVLAQEIIADLKAALEQCREIAVDLDADVLKDRNDRQTSDVCHCPRYL